MTTPRKPYDLSNSDHDYPAWEGPPHHSIVICTHPRSGSTLLGEALYFTGAMGCPLEYFHRGFRPGLERQWGVSGIADFARTVHRRRTGPNGCFALKLFWQDIEEIVQELQPGLSAPPNYLAIRDLIAPLIPNPIFVYLKRTDVVRQAVSTVSAAQSRRWRLIPGIDEKAALEQPSYSFDRIAAQLDFAHYCHGHWARFFEATGIQPYRLTYEDIDHDYQSSMRSLFHHFSIDAPVPAPRMHRQSDASTESFVLRFLRDSHALASAAAP